MLEPQAVVFDSIKQLLKRKNIDIEVTRASVMDDLGLESLDVAELSAILEEELGRDPYSAGVLPETIGQIIDWYQMEPS